MGQQPQLLPHEDFPCFLSLTICTIIRVTRRIRRILIRIVPALLRSISNIKSHLSCKRCCFLIFLEEQHVNHDTQQGDCRDETDDVHVSRK